MPITICDMFNNKIETCKEHAENKSENKERKYLAYHSRTQAMPVTGSEH